ncbi:MAG: tyrosine-type recombinase/integrase [Armatimonadetes bacterium]|nr:tyrosine-type recombinase/integrase [Armatimonadota bacterium]
MFYQTGVRSSECAGLELGDLDLAAGVLHVRRGKGAKDRKLPISDGLAELLQAYLEARPAFRPHVFENGVFVSWLGRRLGQTRIYQIVRGAARRAGIGDDVSPHVLRYAFATHLLQAGAELRHVQEMLGHSRVSVTQVYTRLSVLDVAREHRRTHPRARKISKALESSRTSG